MYLYTYFYLYVFSKKNINQLVQLIQLYLWGGFRLSPQSDISRFEMDKDRPTSRPQSGLML